MYRFPGNMSKRSPARSRGNSSTGKYVAQISTNAQENEIASTSIVRKRPPGRPRSRRGMSQKPAWQNDVDSMPPVYDTKGECNEFKTLGNVLEQHGVTFTKRHTVSNNNTNNNNENNGFVPQNIQAGNSDFFDLQSSQREAAPRLNEGVQAISISPPKQGNLGIFYKRGQMPGSSSDLCMNIFMKTIQRISNFLEIILLSSFILLISAYLEFENCPHKLLGFLTKMMDVVDKLYLMDVSYTPSILIYGAFITTQFVGHYTSILLAKFFSNIGSATTLISSTSLCLSFLVFPSLPSLILDNMHELTIICSIKVFVVLILAYIFNVSFLHSTYENVRPVCPKQIFLNELGLNGSLLVALTFAWDAAITNVPNFTLFSLAVAQVTFLILVISTQTQKRGVTILSPSEGSTTFSFLYESLVWLPFGLTTSLRHCYMCKIEMSSLYMTIFLVVHYSLCLVYSLLYYCIRDSSRPDKVNICMLSCHVCEVAIIFLSFSSMGMDSIFVICFLAFLYVIVIRIKSPQMFLYRHGPRFHFDDAPVVGMDGPIVG